MRALYSYEKLRRLIAPRSIAIVGASSNGGGFGLATLRNLLPAQGRHFPGAVYLVHPKADRIDGQQCWRSLAELPQPPDCVIVAVPRDRVEPVVRECAEVGAGACIIYGSGFAETGSAEGRAQQARLVTLARAAGMLLAGPNCIGISNYVDAAPMTFFGMPTPSSVAEGAVGLVSQSGALGNALSQGMETGVSLSHLLTSGNSCDVDAADYVAYLAQDPACHAIACLFEGLSEPLRMLEAARMAWRAGKPLVVCKLARGQNGAAVAMSHTGSVSGEDAVYRAALERCGVVMVDDFEALLETARFFAKAPPPAPGSRGVAVLAGSGGAAVMAADHAQMLNVELPQPSPRVGALLQQHIPDFGSVRNPVDATAQVLADPEGFSRCIDALLSDETYNALVLPIVFATAGADAAAQARARALSAAAATHGKAACVVWLSQWSDGPSAAEIERDPRVALFRSMRRCFAALAAWQARTARYATAASGQDVPFDAAATQAASEMLRAARRRGDSVLAERHAKSVLAAYGVPVVPEARAASEEQAVQAAQRLGYPVAIKVESPGIPHKTEAGVVRLGITEPTALRQAYQDVMANAARKAPLARIDGVLVQPMVKAGLELMVGGRVDPQFGPLVVVGLGGVLVELLADTQLALAPVNEEQAMDLLLRLRGAALLTGFRGGPAVDLAALARVVCGVSRLMYEHAGELAEVDVNPIVCSGEALLAVDGLITLSTQVHVEDFES